MARKSLSSQVIEELERTARILRPVEEIVDPMTGHMVGTALDCIERALDLCYAARTTSADTILPESPLGTAFGPDKLAQVAPATHKRTNRKNPASVRGEKRN